MNNLIRWLWSHYAFFSARPPPSSNKNFKWMVAIKKSLGNFCLHHFTHMVTASRIGAMHTAQPRLLTLGDHMHNCNILMHIRMPLTALALCLHHLPFILCSIHRIDRIANIIRHSYIEWVFCLRFELMNWIETWIKVAAATTAMSTIMMMMMVVVVAVATVQTGERVRIFFAFCLACIKIEICGLDHKMQSIRNPRV